MKSMDVRGGDREARVFQAHAHFLSHDAGKPPLLIEQGPPLLPGLTSAVEETSGH